jgi:hypothetical protein
MHVYVGYYLHVRTTIELTRAQRAMLLKIAAERGQKGFSKLVQEAIDRYINEEADRRKRVDDALKVLGTIDDAFADRLARTSRSIRESWR